MRFLVRLATCLTPCISLFELALAVRPLHALRNEVITAQLPLQSLFPYGIGNDLSPRDIEIHHHRRSQILSTCPASQTSCASGGGCCPIGNQCGFTVVEGSRVGICEEGGCLPGAATCTHPITACCPAAGGFVCGPDGTCSTTSTSIPKISSPLLSSSMVSSHLVSSPQVSSTKSFSIPPPLTPPKPPRSSAKSSATSESGGGGGRSGGATGATEGGNQNATGVGATSSRIDRFTSIALFVFSLAAAGGVLVL